MSMQDDTINRMSLLQGMVQEKVLRDVFAAIFLQRELSGQKPKHAPFCMKGATARTLLHQIGPNLALN